VPQMLVQSRPSPGLGNGGGASVSRSRLTASLVTLTAFMHFRTGGETVLKRKVQLAFGSAIVILLVVGAVSYRGIFLSSESDRWVRHTHEVLENLQNLVVDMERIESSDRGFALTGEVGYLESYRTSVLSAGQDAAAVRILTIDNPKQLLQISALEALMAQKIRLGGLAILLRRTKGIEAAADAIGNGQGQRIMTECLGIVSKMQDEELRLLLLRNVESNRRRAQTKTILLFGTILGVLIAVGAGWMVSRDIAARGLAEDALREGEERFRNLANNISQLAWMADEKGSIFWYNQRWFDYSGTRLEEMAGWGWQKVQHPDHVERVVEKISRCFRNGEVWEDTFPLRGRDGNYRWFLSQAVPIRDSEGRVFRWFGTSTDISESKKSEEHLVKVVGELKRSNDDLQQFAYVSSHDLQEPLRMVSSYTQLLANRYQGRLDSDADEFIAFAVDGCNRMQGLIQDLLAYSRAGTNGKELHEVSSDNALQEALTNLRITIEQSAAEVTHDSLPAVRTDEAQLTQVFQNLVGNAIKYRGAEAPRVHVSATRSTGNEWTFSVRDNGLGIAPQYFERIFILFQRLHGRDEFEGTGIGLAICKKIVERLGGRIWVESQPEKGSTFYFALPETEGK
jgi:PAS domain S-box-containing protein